MRGIIFTIQPDPRHGGKPVDSMKNQTSIQDRNDERTCSVFFLNPFYFPPTLILRSVSQSKSGET